MDKIPQEIMNSTTGAFLAAELLLLLAILHI